MRVSRAAEPHTDVLVVGAGSAGCALAARLSADPDRRVTVIEAGPAPRRPADFPAELLDAGTVRGADPTSAYNWNHPATLTGGRHYSLARGRILGGSSTINGGYFIRATRADFARWSDGGNDTWRYDRTLPLLRALERDLDFGASAPEEHGADGPVVVSRYPLEDPAARAFVAAAHDLGIADEPDKNSRRQASGVGPVPTNTLRGTRWNSAIGYLLPVLARSNLRVRGGVLARRVVCARGRAVGVEVSDATGSASVLHADRIVLCAGAIGSAELLLRSGIGPAEELAALSIPVVHDSAGVGAGLDDHPQVVLTWVPRRAVEHPSGRWMGAAVNLDDAADGASVEVLQSLVPMSTLVSGRAADGLAPLPLLVSVQAHERSGRLWLRQSGGAVSPRIDLGYLRTDRARARLRAAVRLGVDLVAASGFAPVCAGLTGIDRRQVADDDALDRWIRERLQTSLHLCGTAPFGDAGQQVEHPVVDQHGAVLGVDRLWIADLSILPTAPSRGPANTAVLIGEVLAAALG